MGIPANISETEIALSIGKQTDLKTINTTVWALTKANEDFVTRALQQSNDAPDIGKGTDFPTDVFTEAWDTRGTVDKYTSSQFAAWAFAFALGNVAEAAGTDPGAYVYTIKAAGLPSDCAGIGLPSATYGQAVRKGLACEVMDLAYLGMVVNTLQLTLTTGVGRENSMLNVGIIGTGEEADPSTITYPSLLIEQLLNAAGATIVIHGDDYSSSGKFNTLEFNWNNNLREETGYYPGSGTQDNAAIRGRMERGIRECMTSFSARYEEDSNELAWLKNQTEGAVTITIDGPQIGGGPDVHQLLISMPRTRISMAEIANEDGIVSVNGEITPLVNPGDDKYCDVSVTTDVTGIAQ